MVDIRKYLGIFPVFGGLILLFSINFPAAIYDKYGWGYLEIMAWGWMHSAGIWSYMVYWGFVHNPLVMSFSIIWTVGLVICGIIMIVSGLYFILKLSTGTLNIKFYKVLGISCGMTIILLPIFWMIAVDIMLRSWNVYIYEDAGLSFLKDLKIYGPTICSFVIGPINVIISILIPLRRS